MDKDVLSNSATNYRKSFPNYDDFAIVLRHFYEQLNAKNNNLGNTFGGIVRFLLNELYMSLALGFHYYGIVEFDRQIGLAETKLTY